MAYMQPPFVGDSNYQTPKPASQRDVDLQSLVLQMQNLASEERRQTMLENFFHQQLAASTLSSPTTGGDSTGDTKRQVGGGGSKHSSPRSGNNSSANTPRDAIATPRSESASNTGSANNRLQTLRLATSSPPPPSSVSPTSGSSHSPNVDLMGTPHMLAATPSLSGGQVQWSARVLDQCVVLNDVMTLNLLLANFSHRLNFNFCGPVRLAVDEDNIEMLWAILQFHHIDGLDFNVGAPVRAAVVQGRSIEMLNLLVEAPNVNPNKGCPLFYAAERGDVSAVRALSDHPETSINRFTSAHGTTPLCAAVRAGHDEVVAYLLSHPKIDVNKGYFSTPLQLAVAHGHNSIVRLLLSRASLQVSKVIAGPHPSPLEIAVREKNDQVIEMLLEDPRTEVEEELVDYLEVTNDLEILQLLVASDKLHVKTGRVWNSRFGFCLVGTVLALIEVLLDIHLLYGVYAHGFWSSALLIFAAHTVSSIIATLYLFKPTTPTDYYPLLRLVPLFPVLEVYTLFYMFYHSSTGTPRLQLRQELYVCFRRSFVLRTVGTCLPMAVILAGLSILEGVNRDLAGNVLMCFLIYACLGVVGFKIHHLPAPQGMAVRAREMV